MTDPSIPPCVLVVADSDRIAELVDALSELHGVDVLVSSGGDDTIELFEARRPVVVVLTASLQMGDAKSLMVTLRGMVPRAEVAIIVIGDDAGTIRTALDALDLAPDRFVTRPLSSKALRFAVTGGIDAVRLVRGSPPPPRPALPVAIGTAPGGIDLPRISAHAIRRATPNSSITAVMPLPMTAAAAAGTIPDAPVAVAARAALRARWEALADSIADGPDDAEADESPAPAPIAPTSERSARITVPVDPAELARLAKLAKRASTTTDTAGSEDPGAAAGDSTAPAGAVAELADPAQSAPRGDAAARSTAVAERGVRSDADSVERVSAPSVRSPAAPAARTETAGLVATGEPNPAVTDVHNAVTPVVAIRADGPDARPPAILARSRPGSESDMRGPSPKGLRADSESDARGPSPERLRAGSESDMRGPSPERLRAGSESDVRGPSPKGFRADSESDVRGPSAERMRAGSESDARGPLPEPLRPGSESDVRGPSAERMRAGSESDARGPLPERLRGGSESETRGPSLERLRPGSESDARGPSPERLRAGNESSSVGGSWVERARPGSEPSDEPPPLPPPLVIKPRKRQTDPAIEAVSSPLGAPPAGESFDVTEALDTPPPDALAPPREPTLILREAEPTVPAESRTRTGDGRVVVAARTSSHEFWSEPMPIAALSDRDPAPEAERPSAPRDLLDFDDLDTGTRDPSRTHLPAGGVIDDLPDVQLDAPSDVASPEPRGDAPEPRDFARELRAKMSMMAQRLFQGGDAAVPADHAPRHDHHTEIDLAAFSGDPPLGGSELEPRAAPRHEVREISTSPGAWDTQVRERGVPDSGALVRGVSDAPMLLARMFAQGATGRVAFRRDEVETIVHFDRGRPVFASSNEPRDRMGELLLREGKITASQYERCQTLVAESGRRMGEILVDLGYLKRRELLPAVRRHVEDIVYSLFAWERGSYAIALDAEPCAERIRLSRHAAALILEGIRRKLDRTTLERLIGSTSTVIEVRDRERLGGIVHMGDLAVEERAALAAFDGQADVAHVARTAGVDIADVLPLAWSLCVLGLAIARRTDSELPDESAALVGETDLAIDRERVRARWQLVTDADYFALLGVRRDATGFEIRRAYQSARRDFAADCFPSDLRRELARELDDIAHVLDEAFRVLRDDRLRQTYLANLVD